MRAHHRQSAPNLSTAMTATPNWDCLPTVPAVGRYPHSSIRRLHLTVKMASRERWLHRFHWEWLPKVSLKEPQAG